MREICLFGCTEQADIDWLPTSVFELGAQLLPWRPTWWFGVGSPSGMEVLKVTVFGAETEKVSRVCPQMWIVKSFAGDELSGKVLKSMSVCKNPVTWGLRMKSWIPYSCWQNASPWGMGERRNHYFKLIDGGLMQSEVRFLSLFPRCRDTSWLEFFFRLSIQETKEPYLPVHSVWRSIIYINFRSAWTCQQVYSFRKRKVLFWKEMYLANSVSF